MLKLLFVSIFIVVCVVCGIGSIILSNYLMNEYEFSTVIPVKVEATLLSHSFSPSTEKTRIAPIVGNKGQTSYAIYSTGDAEKVLTVWECGKYGRVTSTDKKVFQYAKDQSILLIRHNNYDTRIVGIIKE